MKIFVNLVYHPVYTLGPGIRAGLWLQGCSIRCKNCISKHTWEKSPKYQVNINDIANIINSFPTDKLTISGGEPLDQAQQLIELLKRVRPTKSDILLYTGYVLENFIESNEKIWEDLKCLVDVIIDGPFIWGKETDSIWKGSENQRMIIINPKLKNIYEEYMEKRKEKKLQFIEKDGELFLAGIPYQKDFEEIIKLSKKLPKNTF